MRTALKAGLLVLLTLSALVAVQAFPRKTLHREKDPEVGKASADILPSYGGPCPDVRARDFLPVMDPLALPSDRLDAAATCLPPVPPGCPPGHTACFLSDRSTHFCCKQPGTCPGHPPETLADAGCITKPGEPVRSPEGPAFLYVWAGPRGWKGNDFLAVFGLDPRKESYGKLLCVSEIDTSGNEAHHMGLSADRKTLIVGGLFSMIKKQPDVYFFDVSSNATCPPYIGSFDVPDASAADDWKPLPEGGFVGTMMGSANGGTPGGIVKFSGGTPDSYEGVYPQQGGKFVGAEDMNPHGIDIRPEVDLMVTTDYMEPASALRHGPTGGIPRGRTTVRMWKLSTMEITQTINVTKVTGRTHRGNYTGFMDVKFIPGDPSGRSFANGGGVIYLIDPVAGTAEPTYVFDSPEVGPCVLAISADGARLWGTLNTRGQVYMFDTTRPEKLAVLDVLELGPFSGPHFMLLLEPEEDRIVVANYFIQMPPEMGVVYPPCDYKVRVANLTENGTRMVLDEGFDVDFNTLPGVPPSNPHRLAYL